MKEHNAKKKIKVYLPLFIVIILIVVVGGYWYRQYSKFIKTDDAYIDTDNISVSSKMMARLVNVYVNEGDSVQLGELLAELDSSDLIAQKIHFLALKYLSEANMLQAEAQYKYNSENIRILEINFKRTEDDYNRAKSQFEGSVISQEKYDHAKNAYDAGKAQLNAAKSQLKVSEAQVVSARAAVKSSEAQVQIVETQLKNTRLYAPISGIVARQWLLKGDLAQPGQSIFTLTNNKKLWVLVYLEETKIADVHLNQKALFTIDAFPGVTFKGKVFARGSNTASQFSLIPPNNASGNFTKVTQRVPVKISIDGTENHKSLDNYKILAGISVVVKIIRD